MALQRGKQHIILNVEVVLFDNLGLFNTGMFAGCCCSSHAVATVACHCFYYYFRVSIALPLPCINYYLYFYTRKGAGRWKHENDNKNSGKWLWMQHTGTISERDGNPNSSTLHRACTLEIGTIWERGQYQNVTTGDLLFLVRFHRRRRRSANTFQLSGKIPEANFFKLHMVDLWVWENFFTPISVTLGQGH